MNFLPLLRETEDEWLAALVELKDFINLRFGRVLNVLPSGSHRNGSRHEVWRICWQQFRKGRKSWT